MKESLSNERSMRMPKIKVFVLIHFAILFYKNILQFKQKINVLKLKVLNIKKIKQ